jgi:hypothetical protein
MKDNVQFLIDNEGDVFAYFPDLAFDMKGNNTSYAHIGQHSACSPDYSKECVKATPEQYKDLEQELIGLGYNLNILP